MLSISVEAEGESSSHPGVMWCHKYGGQLTDLPSNIKALLAAKDNDGDGTTDIVLLAGKFSTEANPFIKDGVRFMMQVINKIKELAASIKGKTLVEKSNASNMETERC
ncbi:T-complex protein 1 subunit eta [Tanacetum coccineum]